MRNGGGGGNSSGGGSSNMRGGGRGHMGSNGGASGSHGRAGRNLVGGGANGNLPRGGQSVAGGASGNIPRGGKSVGGGSGNSREGGSSRVGGGIGANGSTVGGERRGQMFEHHFTNEIRGIGASSDDSDYSDYDDEYENDEFDDDDDEDLGGNNDNGDVGSEDECDGGSEDGVEGGSEEEVEADEVEGGDEGSEDDEEVTAQHNRRGYSLGIFGQPPPQPYLIRMRDVSVPRMSTDDSRDGGVASRNCSLYYDFDPKHGTKNDAREALNTHMRRNMRKTLCNERRRIKKIIEKKGGGSFIDHRPPYLTEAVWKPICDHWESPTFQKKSDSAKEAKEAREQQKIPHTFGAISFQRRAWDIRDKTGEVPTLYELFIRLHTKDKDNKEFTSEAVRIIVEKFLAKCVEHNEDPHAAAIDTWVEAVGVRKNAIIGLPRRSASELIGASTSRPVIEHISDGLVMQAVDRTVAFSHAHPDQFDLTPEQVNMLAQSVTKGVSDLPPDHPLTMTTMRNLVQVMVSVLGDVYGDNLSTSNCNKVCSGLII
ncbi:hypothetical protein POM88_026577 [Heracleum sosnowskyi]|uniref:Uncharacterized protein n=1 Tax=Heracleum sosnowskyi TaxID=360622 RepID=A0AAD8MQ46_9APIA|nr:hypothetical protein POM88_026577 [Heracleum sosnowskyi]